MSEPLIDIRGKSNWLFRRRDETSFDLTRTFDFEKPHSAWDAMGSLWFVATGTARNGSVVLKSGGQNVSLHGAFALFYPAFSVTKLKLPVGKLKLQCIISESKPFRSFPTHPLAKSLSSMPKSTDPKTLFELPGQTWSFDPVAPSAIAKRIKNGIDRDYCRPVTLGEQAKKLRLSPTQFGRYFQSSYGVRAVKYRNRMRVTLAGYLLLRRRPIMEVFQDVGFFDLSRFNKQFKETSSVTPSRFQPKKSRKTPSG